MDVVLGVVLSVVLPIGLDSVFPVELSIVLIIELSVGPIFTALQYIPSKALIYRNFNLSIN